MKQFDYVQANKPKRSAFDLSHERKTTLNMGELVPVACLEVLPGDRFKISLETFLRTLPLISPVMHRVNVFAHAFFVPNRLTLITERWENFITKKNNSDVLPSIDPDAFRDGSASYLPTDGDLLDHLNYGYLLDGPHRAGRMSQMPIRAYHKIWNDYYRDQNFQNEYDIVGLPDNLAYGSVDLPVFCSVRKRAWEKDYFTAALPSQQRGNVVSLPLGDHAPVRSTYDRTGDIVADSLQLKKPSGADSALGALKTGATVPGRSELEDSASDPAILRSGLEVDLSAAVGTSITALRRAFSLQRWYEASMRFGQRYVEQLLGLFGVVSRDARLQRAEYLGGGKLPIQIGEVLQTSETATTPQGTMAGHAVSIGNIVNIDRTFDEHGFLMIIVSVLPRTSYSTLALRQNFKLDTFDFAFPQLAHLSEQPVYNGEIWNVGNSDDIVRQPFGYQPVYSEYRYVPDSVHGKFRTSLHYWGLQREFTSIPGLNETFVVSDPATRIFPVDSPSGQLLLQTFAKITAIRPLPKFGTPV